MRPALSRPGFGAGSVTPSASSRRSCPICSNASLPGAGRQCSTSCRATARSGASPTTGLDPLLDCPGPLRTAKLGGWRSYVDDDAFFLAPMAPIIPIRSSRPRSKRCMPRPAWVTNMPNASSLRAPAGCVSNCSSRTCLNRTARNSPPVQIHRPAQRRAGVSGGLPEQPFVDVRPYLAAHRPVNTRSDDTTLLSYAINFGAYIEGSDNSILYAGRG